MTDIKMSDAERKAKSIATKLNTALGFSTEGKSEPLRAFYPVVVDGVPRVRFYDLPDARTFVSLTERLYQSIKKTYRVECQLHSDEATFGFDITDMNIILSDASLENIRSEYFKGLQYEAKLLQSYIERDLHTLSAPYDPSKDLDYDQSPNQDLGEFKTPVDFYKYRQQEFFKKRLITSQSDLKTIEDLIGFLEPPERDVGIKR